MAQAVWKKEYGGRFSSIGRASMLKLFADFQKSKWESINVNSECYPRNI